MIILHFYGKNQFSENEYENCYTFLIYEIPVSTLIICTIQNISNEPQYELKINNITNYTDYVLSNLFFRVIFFHLAILISFMNMHNVAGNHFCYLRKTSFKHLERKD